jgi:hypothetical protein
MKTFRTFLAVLVAGLVMAVYSGGTAAAESKRILSEKHSAVDVSIDGKKFKLFTIEGRAYAESEEDDVAMVRAMKRGRKMTVVGTSSRGTVTTDSYSLSGFTKTKNLIDKTCK